MSDRTVVGMLCPVCQVSLVMAERQGVEIDYCPQCRGVWLDRGELDKIIERAAAEAPRQATQYEPRERQAYRDDRRSDYGKHGRPQRRKSFLSDIFDFD